MAEYHGVWSHLAKDQLPVDENLATWTSEERSQYLLTNGVVTEAQDCDTAPGSR